MRVLPPVFFAMFSYWSIGLHTKCVGCVLFFTRARPPQTLDPRSKPAVHSSLAPTQQHRGSWAQQLLSTAKFGSCTKVYHLCANMPAASVCASASFNQLRQHPNRQHFDRSVAERSYDSCIAVVLILANVTATLMAMAIGAAAPSNSVANMAGSLAIMLFLLFGGFMLNKDQVRGPGRGGLLGSNSCHTIRWIARLHERAHKNSGRFAVLLGTMHSTS